MSNSENPASDNSTPNSSQENYQERALYDATFNNDLARMKQILSTHPQQVHFEENSGLTPLEAAIWQGSIDAARLHQCSHLGGKHADSPCDDGESKKGRRLPKRERGDSRF